MEENKDQDKLKGKYRTSIQFKNGRGIGEYVMSAELFVNIKQCYVDCKMGKEINVIEFGAVYVDEVGKTNNAKIVFDPSEVVSIVGVYDGE